MKAYLQVPKQVSAYAVIWLHGLGASAEDMQGVAQLMETKDLVIKHVFLDAPMRPVTINQGMVMPAWYDILGTQLTDREDRAGLEASRAILMKTIASVCEMGFQRDQIILAGFSQGAALALYTALHCKEALAGVVSLSGYLPLSTSLQPMLPTETPIFIGYGRYDPVVMPAWTQLTASWLQSNHYQAVTVKDYPMEHRICPEELAAMSAWMQQLKRSAHVEY